MCACVCVCNTPSWMVMDNEKKKYGLVVLCTVPVQQNVLSVCCMGPSSSQ